LKDRLYTFAPSARARRSAQTALWRIAEALTRLIAPILSFTADEVWGYLPKVAGRENSVHLALFPDVAEIVPGSGAGLEAEWEKLLEVRSQVLAKLEVLRAEKVIGKSLEAVVTLSEGSDGLLRKYATALPELFNVSEVELLDAAEREFSVRRSEKPKCERCWRYVQEVGQDDRFPTVCVRCADALEAIEFPPYGA
jgi:isoleucyl-tRNA synthetase